MDIIVHKNVPKGFYIEDIEPNAATFKMRSLKKQIDDGGSDLIRALIHGWVHNQMHYQKVKVAETGVGSME